MTRSHGSGGMNIKAIVTGMVIGIAVLSVVGCDKPNSTTIAGAYARTDGPLTESILVNTDGTFDQTVTYSHGQVFTASGTWSNVHRQVRFTRLYITRDIEAAQVLSSPELRYGVNFTWANGVLAKHPEQGYLLRRQQKN